MADYYPLIARALDGLPDAGDEGRRSVYDRARSALASQLRSVTPPLGEAEIARELTALEDAIDRAERAHASERRQDASLDAELADPSGSAGSDAASRPQLGKPPEIRRGGRRGRRLVTTIGLLVVIVAIATAAWLWRDQPRPAVVSETPRPTAAAPAPAQNDPKFPERVGGGPVSTVPVTPALPAAPTPPIEPRAPAAVAPAEPVGQQPGGASAEQPPASAPVPAAPVENPVAESGSQGTQDVAVAQRAALVEENQTEPPQPPKVTNGRTLWRLDTINAGQGQPLETVVRATVEVPEAGMSLSLEMRRNRDATFPASHTIDLSFTTKATDPGLAVRDVALPQMGADETARGTPLAGLPVPVKENRFLIGLSDLPADVSRNTDLLLNRGWMQLQLRFASGQRAVLLFEKGVAGDRVIHDAFRMWAQP